jgi:hypothetical protein
LSDLLQPESFDVTEDQRGPVSLGKGGDEARERASPLPLFENRIGTSLGIVSNLERGMAAGWIRLADRDEPVAFAPDFDTRR